MPNLYLSDPYKIYNLLENNSLFTISIPLSASITGGFVNITKNISVSTQNNSVQYTLYDDIVDVFLECELHTIHTSYDARKISVGIKYIGCQGNIYLLDNEFKLQYFRHNNNSFLLYCQLSDEDIIYSKLNKLNLGD